MSNSLWLQQKSKGDWGESLVADYFRANGDNVELLTDNPVYWKKDIDFRINGYDCELKTDFRMNRTGNLYLEQYIEYKSDGSRKDGWFRITEAQLLFYLDAHTRTLYVYAMKDLRDYLQTHIYCYKPTYDSNKTVYGYCVPKDCVYCQTYQL